MKIFFFIIITLSWVNSTQAQICKQISPSEQNVKNVDLRNEVGPIRDQGSIGWCYAFVASDLLTQYLRKRGEITGDPSNKNLSVSPIGMASWYNKKSYKDYYKDIWKFDSKQLQQYNEKMDALYKMQDKEWDPKKVVPEAGTVGECLNETFIHGYCLESDAPSESFNTVFASYCLEKNICASSLEDLFNFIYDRARFDKNDINAFCTFYDITQAAYPNIPEKILKDILSKTTRDRVFYDLAAAACKKKIKIQNSNQNLVQTISIKEDINEPADKLIVAMDHALDSGSIVGVSYYSKMLKEKNAPKEDEHASAIVGKFFDKGTCEVRYVLRNSWGPSCGDYMFSPPAYFECMQKESSIEGTNDQFMKERDCSQKFPPKARNPKVSCDAKTGYVTVAKSELKKYIYEISFIP